MDTVTHALSGAVLSLAGLEQLDPHAMLVTTVATCLPDLDYAAQLRGDASSIRHHRGVTHTLPALLATALLVAAAAWLVLPDSRFWPCLLCALVGTLLHTLLDMTNAHGASFLRARRTAWDLMPVTDPYLLFGFSTVVVLGLVWPMFQGTLSLAALASAALYVGLRACLRQRVLSLLRCEIKAIGAAGLPQQSARFGVYPLPHTPFRWHVVLDRGPAYFTAEVCALNGESREIRRYDKLLPAQATEPPSPSGTSAAPPDMEQAIERARETPEAQAFLEFAVFPYLTLEPSAQGFRVCWQDLRWAYRLAGRRMFYAQVEIDKSLQVVSAVVRQ